MYFEERAICNIAITKNTPHRLPEFINEDQLGMIILDCSTKVYEIKDIIRKMLEKLDSDNGKDSYVMGLGLTILYSHELEQLGKLLHLKLLKYNGKRPEGYPLREKLQGIWFNHDEKIKTALDYLPPECKIWTDFESEGFNPRVLPEQVIEPDLRTRMEILHTDILEDGTIPQFPPININKLRKALEIFDKEEWKVDRLRP